MCGALAASSAMVIAPHEVLSVIVYLAAVSMVSLGSALKVRVAAARSGFFGRRRRSCVMPAAARLGVALAEACGGVARAGLTVVLFLPYRVTATPMPDADAGEHQDPTGTPGDDALALGALLLALRTADGTARAS